MLSASRDKREISKLRVVNLWRNSSTLTRIIKCMNFLWFVGNSTAKGNLRCIEQIRRPSLLSISNVFHDAPRTLHARPGLRACHLLPPVTAYRTREREYRRDPHSQRKRSYLEMIASLVHARRSVRKTIALSCSVSRSFLGSSRCCPAKLRGRSRDSFFSRIPRVAAVFPPVTAIEAQKQRHFDKFVDWFSFFVVFFLLWIQIFLVISLGRRTKRSRFKLLILDLPDWTNLFVNHQLESRYFERNIFPFPSDNFLHPWQN